MPLYDHYCSQCDTITEEICHINERKQFIPCKNCGASAERIITAKIQRVEPTWLNDAKRSLNPEARASIKDRNDLASYCRKEGIEHIG
jgi:putative FmdB family regulatory protein